MAKQISKETKEKILSCHGKLTLASTARVFGIPYANIYALWNRNDLEVSPRASWRINQRSY